MCIKYVIHHQYILAIRSYDVYKRVLYNLIKQNKICPRNSSFLIEVFNISNSDGHLFDLCYFYFQMNFNLFNT